MPEIKLTKIDSVTAFKITDILKNSPKETVTLDISNLRFVFPFGSLVLASELAYHNLHYSTIARLIGYSDTKDAHSYLGHIGFFKTARFNLGNDLGVAKGSGTYIPFTKISKDCLLKKQSDYEDEHGITQPLQYFIQTEAEKIARIITTVPEEVDTLAYCFREIIRNVFEHSEIDECMVCGQKYSGQNARVEIAIIDNGCGIANSLKNNFGVTNDRQALNLCLQPGISGKDTKANGVWSNSGFGLYILSELGKRFGKFMLCSGEHGIECSYSKKEKLNSYGYHGTAIQLSIDLNHFNKVMGAIDQIANEGEKIAQLEGRTVKASKYSRILW
jgi:hypothetical protein